MATISICVSTEHGSTDGCLCGHRRIACCDVPAAGPVDNPATGEDFYELTMRASEKLQQARKCYRDDVARQTKDRLTYLREAADIISSARDLA